MPAMGCLQVLPTAAHLLSFSINAEARMSRAEAASLVGMAGWRLHGKVRAGPLLTAVLLLLVAGTIGPMLLMRSGVLVPLLSHVTG